MDLTRWSEAQQQFSANPNPSTNPYAHAYDGYYNAQRSSYPHHLLYSSHQSQIPIPAPIHREIASTSLVPSSDAGLRPPGVDAYAAALITQTHVAYEAPAAAAYSDQAAAAYYQSPGVAHDWAAAEAVRQYGADLSDYAAAGESPNKKTIVPQIPTTMLSKTDCISHPLANNGITKTPSSNVVQSLRCEVCNIDCNSKDVLDQHILGKKHKRNLLNSNAPVIAPIPKIPRRTKKKSLIGEVGQTVDQGMKVGPLVLTATEDFEAKRQNLVVHGAAVDSVMVCGICDVVCNSQIVFYKHLAGKKHAAQAGVRPNGIDTLALANQNPPLLVNQLVQPSFKKAVKLWPKRTKIVQSAWCEICKIDCNSKDVLDQHKLGKKHKKNMEKLEESKRKAAAPASDTSQTANNPVIGPPENPLSERGRTVGAEQSRKKVAPSATIEDLETKRRKVMESGAATEAVRVCTICNVVCNSDKVFNYHLAGQKHASMVKKQAAGPQAITAA